MNKQEIQDKLKQMEQEMAALRKKLDEPEVELYRGYIPALREQYWAIDGDGEVNSYTNWDEEEHRVYNLESIFGTFRTMENAQAAYDRHMAGEECKKIISKWIAKLEPGWKPDWTNEKCKYYCSSVGGVVVSGLCKGVREFQNEWYYPLKVAENEDFQKEITPYFKKWLGVE